MKAYTDLMKKIILEGTKKDDTLSLFGETLEFNLSKGFPIVTTRKINYSAAFAELACFLRGYTDVRQFNDMGVKFWDADCFKESWNANVFKGHEHDLGKIYGYQWKEGFGFDQIERLVKAIKDKPTSRRHILTTYNPADIKKGCLPPCYVTHQFYSVEGHLDMLVHQRSADYCIGVPFDVCSFAMFQHLMAKETGLKPRKLKIIFGDVHIYESHFPGVQQQIKKNHLPLPKLILDNVASIYNFTPDMAALENYGFHPAIKFPFMTQD